ncbi:hypothetical protein [Primorskyibacter sp. S187A]|uniref:hypothetical protein n=1 Tax=Primorskyibacter sp. S187A TaxID=3415130 RepID=UPI003C7E5DC0
MTLSIFFFVLFGASGLYAGLKGQRNIELWLVIPPVLLAVALAIWRYLSGDLALGLILSGMLTIFAASAAGSLVGLGLGRLVAPRGRTQ